MAYSPLFVSCIEFIINNFEGVTLSLDPKDSGNWTGGKVGSGELKGSKFGLSAAAYPKLDFANLTIEEAKPIYHTDYWAKINGDNLPPVMALPVLDFAINSGVNTAAKLLQQYLAVPVDCVIGTAETIPALINKIDVDKDSYVVAEYCALRLAFLQKTKNWPRYSQAWQRRVLMIPFETAKLVV